VHLHRRQNGWAGRAECVASVHDGVVQAASPPRRLTAALVVATAMVLGAGVASAATARVHDDTGLLRPAERAEVERQAAAVAAAGAPVEVTLRRLDESQDQTIADAAALMSAERVESAPGAHDGLVVLVSLRPGGDRHGTAAIYAGAALLAGRVPEGELQRVYDEEMAPRLEAGEVGAAVDAGLAAVARDLRDGPPGRSAAEAGAAAVTRVALDPAALLLLAVVAVTAVRVWRRRSVVAVGAELRPAAPGDAPPAVAGALWQAHLHPSLVRATLLDLARRGAVRMEGGRRPPLRLRCVDATALQTPWERALWSALVAASDRDGWVGRRRLGRVLSRPHTVLAALREELWRRGLFDPRMPAIRRPLWLGGAAGLVLTAVTAGVAMAGLEPWGWLGVAAAGSAAFLGFGVAARLPEITPEGGRAAAAWEGYRRVLAARFRDPDDPIDWDEHLAHAVALCLDREMDGRLLRDSRAGYAPAWADLRDGDEGGFAGMWVVLGDTGGGSSGGGGGNGGGAGAGGGGAGGSF
jgi:uncharacterized membrane protein YgcG